MSAAVTFTPSSRRSRFSSRILRLKGRRLRLKPRVGERGQAVDGVGAVAGGEHGLAGKAVHLGKPFYPRMGGC